MEIRAYRSRVWETSSPLFAGAEFSAIAAMLELSEANLSKTVRNLVELGYLSSSKQASPERSDAHQITTIKLTPLGRRAFDGHLAALRAMAGEQ